MGRFARRGNRIGQIGIGIVALILIYGCAVPQGTPAAVVTQSPIVTVEASRTVTATVPAQPSTTQPEPTSSPQPSVTPSAPSQAMATPGQETTPVKGDGILVDHNSIALFDQIPDEYLKAARALRMVYIDQSVGFNISQALDCLAAPSWGQSPAYCRRDYIDQASWNWKTFTAADLSAGSVPARIQFPAQPTRYNRANWTFVSQAGSWEDYYQAILRDLFPGLISQNDVISFQFTYLHVAPGSTIASPTEGFFIDQPKTGFYTNRERWDISDYVDLEQANPDKVFIYWTTSLARGIGSEESTLFNQQMRQYAAEHNKPLFDVADILSHDEQGEMCVDHRDGVEYCSNGCENYPDDGVAQPAICQDYTTETDGGHLGSVSGAKIRLAKAFWVLMAQIAGWQPEG